MAAKKRFFMRSMIVPRGCKGKWLFCVNLQAKRRAPRTAGGARVAAMFGLQDQRPPAIYKDFRFSIAPGEILAVVGPSGAGKSVLLREAMRQVRGARLLTTARVARSSRSPVDRLRGGGLPQRMEMLSRCGLADARALITPARLLSGGQQYRLALAEALHEGLRAGRPGLIVADEFASCLDSPTAAGLCRNIRRLIRPGGPALLVATPRGELLAPLQPDRVIVKPLGAPPRVMDGAPLRRLRAARRWDPGRRPIEPGTIRDYDELSVFHYMAGRPAAHKRVWLIRPPATSVDAGGPRVAAVLVVSPPLGSVRGRNLATGGRYAGADRAAALALVNREVEWISRVIVHPAYRGCGLAVRLVRHALATAKTPMVESLAAMGAVNPFFERAGMKAWMLEPDPHGQRLLKAAAAVGLSPREVAAIGPVKRLVRRRSSRRAAFLRREVKLCIARMMGSRRARRLGDPLAEVCRRTARQYVYYLWRRDAAEQVQASWPEATPHEKAQKRTQHKKRRKTFPRKAL
jgi:ABC-type lipoprotein export system ATPase subunit/GNAT superfamily N-acetyltransferase